MWSDGTQIDNRFRADDNDVRYYSVTVPANCRFQVVQVFRLPHSLAELTIEVSTVPKVYALHDAQLSQLPRAVIDAWHSAVAQHLGCRDYNLLHLPMNAGLHIYLESY